MKNGHFSSLDVGRQLSEKAQFYMTSWQDRAHLCDVLTIRDTGFTLGSLDVRLCL